MIIKKVIYATTIFLLISCGFPKRPIDNSEKLYDLFITLKHDSLRNRSDIENKLKDIFHSNLDLKVVDSKTLSFSISATFDSTTINYLLSSELVFQTFETYDFNEIEKYFLPYMEELADYKNNKAEEYLIQKTQILKQKDKPNPENRILATAPYIKGAHFGRFNIKDTTEIVNIFSLILKNENTPNDFSLFWNRCNINNDSIDLYLIKDKETRFNLQRIKEISILQDFKTRATEFDKKQRPKKWTIDTISIVQLTLDDKGKEVIYELSESNIDKELLIVIDECLIANPVFVMSIMSEKLNIDIDKDLISQFIYYLFLKNIISNEIEVNIELNAT